MKGIENQERESIWPEVYSPSPQVRNQSQVPQMPTALPTRDAGGSTRGHLWGQAQASPCLPCASSSGVKVRLHAQSVDRPQLHPQGGRGTAPHWAKSACPPPPPPPRRRVSWAQLCPFSHNITTRLGAPSLSFLLTSISERLTSLACALPQRTLDEPDCLHVLTFPKVPHLRCPLWLPCVISSPPSPLHGPITPACSPARGCLPAAPRPC